MTVRAKWIVVALVAGHGCTCYSLSEPVQTECGDFGQPCCTEGCNGGCNSSFFQTLACVDDECVAESPDGGPKDVTVSEAHATCASGLACERCVDAEAYAPVVMGTPAATMDACTQNELQAFATA